MHDESLDLKFEFDKIVLSAFPDLVQTRVENFMPLKVRQTTKFAHSASLPLNNAFLSDFHTELDGFFCNIIEPR